MKKLLIILGLLVLAPGPLLAQGPTSFVDYYSNNPVYFGTGRVGIKSPEHLHGLRDWRRERSSLHRDGVFGRYDVETPHRWSVDGNGNRA